MKSPAVEHSFLASPGTARDTSVGRRAPLGARSKSNRSMLVARFENTLKLTPSAVTLNEAQLKEHARAS